MISKFYLVVSVIILFSFKISAQQSNLSFGVDGVVHEDTLSIGDTINFNFWIVNQGSSNYNDSIFISCETFDDFGMSISAMSIGSFYNISGSLNPGDSLFVSISEVVTYQSYVLGDNIVVIWPASIGNGTVDTSVTNVHIYDSLLTILDGSNDQIDFYPNPIVNNFLYIESKYPILSLRIVNYLGHTLYVRDNIDSYLFSVSLSKFKAGIYFVEYVTRKSRVVNKVLLK